VIRGVIFDFGNVICSFDVGRFLERLEAWSGVPSDTLRRRVYGSALHAAYERGEITSGEFREQVESATGTRIPVPAFEEAFNGIFTPLDGTSALIRQLKGRCRLGLLSNTNECHFRGYIRETPVYPLFDSVTLSFQVGALKPHAAIYRDALAKLSLPPEACVFIDDIAEYVEGANSLGIHGIRFTGAAALSRDLSALGVLPSPA
jgi:glucose-1-phosphatase